ncbi:MAG: 4Fe-4S binding protein [Nitrospiraceae bacterium]|nr:MAG: 4Fe-4S binding protein [Nitrospiraceae bacterium]
MKKNNFIVNGRMLLKRSGRKVGAILLIPVLGLLIMPTNLFACGGKDVTLSDNPKEKAHAIKRGRKGISLFDEQGNILVNRSKVKISSERAQQIAERYASKIRPTPALPLTFRKLEWVHKKLVYQFETEPVTGFNGKYHLGPVNFTVDRMVLDVDAMTGNIHLANGCGAAPGKLLYKYDPRDFTHAVAEQPVSLISNNTNFIARKTGNSIKIDGIIDPSEWKDTGHKYFYLGNYNSHSVSQSHVKASYYAEVWTQIDNENIYFAVKTDTPYWVGLMFKKDANLGMLGAYRDAKVLRSHNVIDDRHFSQRPDKTFFLKNDEQDDIFESAARQGEFYTYEFVYPLKSDDKNDVSFEIGKAYNMLLVIGNTLDHHGIFTLDDAHKNHDHSKNNKEHADVWASTEQTIRIGSPPVYDILGSTVTPFFQSYTSGYDAKKSNVHFHYAETALNDFGERAGTTSLIAILALLAGLAATAVMLLKLSSRKSRSEDTPDPAGDGIDLLQFGWLKQFVTWKYFRLVFIIPTLIIFTAIVFYGILDIQDGRKNISTVYTWTIWWSLIIFSFILLGRFWCMMCPFAAIGDFVQKFISLNRRLPRQLQNMGIQTLGFIVLTLAFSLFMFESRPLVTAVVILIILSGAVVSSILYEKRSFCRHLCPIGAIIGLYSAVSPLELRRSDKVRCNNHKDKACSYKCPMLESPHDNADSIYCNFCMKCVSACPSSNLTLRLRPVGSALFKNGRRSIAEALASLFLLGVIIVETLAMTSAWEPLKQSVSSWSGIESQTAVYMMSFGLVVILPILVFYSLCYLLRNWLGDSYRINGLVTDFALVFIPAGIAVHLAHNVQHMFLEGTVAVPATLRFLQNMGIGTSLFINYNTSPLVGAETLFFAQMVILIAGLFLTLFILYRLLRSLDLPFGHIYKMTTAMSLYAMVVILTSIYMIGLPMSGRHIH